tara:strand:- start:958 stop:1404 length:447 start_codon:yes stop_codon:yes gene_type:complete
LFILLIVIIIVSQIPKVSRNHKLAVKFSNSYETQYNELKSILNELNSHSKEVALIDGSKLTILANENQENLLGIYTFELDIISRFLETSNLGNESDVNIDELISVIDEKNLFVSDILSEHNFTIYLLFNKGEFLSKILEIEKMYFDII